ncbi:putative thioesterase involved in non-ribosomal peptide biosynthesis [Frankia casuarinae]|uniref:Thioesterase n=1 Tax=Frankia casuarinae (strain DSM 45818 / CECT 9043 / HFP020203 / CcI3) TaxID=106370 RepID=Q2JCL3_FRACC|nr:alpha/beta fold hydrolase [Frankia casuarinae]ABD10979.1 Thioesterase [Frankia casuarinae]EYT92335.1 putative thioesterase involved in non-ribosomal peptide biosynthesis [Frankia casuarinae]
MTGTGVSGTGVSGTGVSGTGLTGTGLTGRTWLRYEPTDAAVRLICLPHAGAGASSFARWLGLFPSTVAAVRVQLPGREDVVAEPALRLVHDAVDALLPQVTRLIDPPVALYGHSMGALVAFELARALSAAGIPPVHLFVSGRRAPHRPASRAPIHHLPDDALVAALKTMGDTGGSHRSAAFLRYTLRLTRVDLTLSEEYAYRSEPRLRCPITAFYGTADPVVDLAEIEAWRDETDAAFAVHTFPGDHFFHQRHRVAIAARIAAALE